PLCPCLSLLVRRPTPLHHLFPYTTLFRSDHPITAGVSAIKRLNPNDRDDHFSRHAIFLLGALKRSLVLAPEIDPLSHTRFSDEEDRKSTRLNSSHVKISYAVFCLKKKTID